MKRHLLLSFVVLCFCVMITGCDSSNKGNVENGTKRPIGTRATSEAKTEVNTTKETEKATKDINKASVDEEKLLAIYDKLQESISDIIITYRILSYDVTTYAGLGTFCGKMAECIEGELPDLREIYNETKDIKELKEFNSIIRKAIEISPTKYTGKEITGMQNYLYHFRDFYNKLIDAEDEIENVMDEYGVEYYDIFKFEKIE